MGNASLIRSSEVPTSLFQTLPRARPLAAILLAVAITAAVGPLANAQGVEAGESGRRELIKAVSLAGTPLAKDPGGVNPTDFDEAWTRLWGLYQYRDWSIQNVELAGAWSGIERHTESGLLILSSIAKIDNSKPSGIEILWKMTRDNKTDQQKTDAQLTILERLAAEGQKVELEGKFRDAEADLYRSIGSLGNVGAQLAGQEIPHAMTIAYLPSWRGILPNDTLEVRNTSGEDLDYGALVVTVHDKNGQSLTHVHYVDRWPNGSVLLARYPYKDSGYAYGKALPEPTSMDAALYLPSGTATASYTISQKEWDAIVASYCSRLRFGGNFLGEYTDSNSQTQPPGFQFSFEGLSELPVKSVTITFWSSDETQRGAIWKIDGPLEAGKAYPYRTSLFSNGGPAFSAASPPKHVDITLGLAGTDHEVQVRFY
jgi:hypothetical protein